MSEGRDFFAKSLPGSPQQHDETDAGGGPERQHPAATAFTCPTCRKGFAQRLGYQMHVRTHDPSKLHGCPECGKQFRQPGHLRKHMRAHTRERPYACAECPKRFMHGRSLKAHADRKHAAADDGNRPPSPPEEFQCHGCPAMFRRRGLMVTHARSGHRRPGGKPACPVCTTRFRNPINLTAHLHTKHSPPPPGPERLCQECVGSFRREGRPFRGPDASPSPPDCVACAECYSDADRLAYRCIVCPTAAEYRDPRPRQHD